MILFHCEKQKKGSRNPFLLSHARMVGMRHNCIVDDTLFERGDLYVMVN